MRTIFFLFLFVQLVTSHSYIRTDIGKARIDTPTNWYKNNQKPCFLTKDKGKPQDIKVQRGQVIDFSWPRNNHHGGFIKLAIVPFEQSDDQDAFDKNVFHYGCFQTTCTAKNPDENPYGRDPPEYGPNNYLCKNKLTIPGWIEDGQYTIQWKWYGGSQFGKIINNKPSLTGMILYRSCLDFTVNGGEKTSKPNCPTWKGGDVHTRDGDTCSFFLPEGSKSINEYQCKPGGCEGKNTTGKPPEVENCQQYGRS